MCDDEDIRYVCSEHMIHHAGPNRLIDNGQPLIGKYDRVFFDFLTLSFFSTRDEGTLPPDIGKLVALTSLNLGVTKVSGES